MRLPWGGGKGLLTGGPGFCYIRRTYGTTTTNSSTTQSARPPQKTAEGTTARRRKSRLSPWAGVPRRTASIANQPDAFLAYGLFFVPDRPPGLTDAGESGTVPA